MGQGQGCNMCNTINLLIHSLYYFLYRTDLNLCAAYNNNNTNCIHRFCWSFSSIYLFMELGLVSNMALNYLPGTQIRILNQQVHLIIPEICDNATITIDEEQNQWECGVLLLNKLTTFVSTTFAWLYYFY